MLDEDLLLVFQILADALGHRDGGTLQLQHAERDAVDVEHKVGAFGVGIIAGCRNGNFLGDGEMIILRMLPINEPDIHRILTHARLHLHGVAQHVIHGAVPVVEALAGVARRLVEEVERPRDERLVVTLLLAEKLPQQGFLNVPVAFAVSPVAEVVVAQRVAKQRDHALLGLLLDLANGAHHNSPNVLPVRRSSCIIARLRARVFDRSCSNAASSAVHVRQHFGDGGSARQSRNHSGLTSSNPANRTIQLHCSFESRSPGKQSCVMPCLRSRSCRRCPEHA